MIWTLLLAIIIGILCGIVTGLTPGIHINLISVLIVSMSSILLEYTSALFLATIIISMGVTHTFLDSIPSIFLGAPDTDTVMAVLPGHKLLFQGLGWDAVRLTVIGSLLCLILCIAIIPLLALVFPILYNLMKNYIGYLLIVMVGFIILKDSKRIWAIVIFIFSGILGLIVLNSDISQPLFPMLSGMFGISALLISLFQKVEVPTQIATEYIKIGKGEYMQSLVGGVFSGSFVALFPGIGAAQAAAMSTVFFKVKEYGYLILVGGINTVNFIIALVTVYTLDKARNGAIVAVMEIITNIDLARLITFAAIALIVGGIATILTLKIAKLFAFMIEEINYNMISGFILLFIIGLAFYFSGFIGLLVLFISTALGIIPQI
ncbi:tripartite tricarboxylate transporter permease, partial [Candidatus Woesearchaeota archaeon]|nr:tripartite tricarboxylate transporter permease [Candidatus Woesearchaeota archaeon]